MIQELTCNRINNFFTDRRRVLRSKDDRTVEQSRKVQLAASSNRSGDILKLVMGNE